jgi:hypothetical protein
LVDITAMLMVLLFIVCYLASTRKMHESKILMALLGFLFFLAFKTKETTLPVGILFLGLWIDNENVINWKIFIRRLGYVFIGVCVAIVFFAVLNWIFLGDPLFGMRPNEFSKFFGTYIPATLQEEKYSGAGNWYISQMFTALWIPFTLYLVSGVRPTFISDINRGIRLIWLVPLLSIIVVIMSVGNLYGYMQRFIYPAIPVICFLGPQFLNFDLHSAPDRRQRNTALAIFIVGLLAMIVIRVFMRQTFPNKGWDVTTFMTAVFIPVLFSAILALVFLWKKTPLTVSHLIAVLIIAIAIIPISHNIKQIAYAQPNRKITEDLFYPFSAFSDQIHYTSDMEFFVSPDVWRKMGTFYSVKDRLEIASLFNVFFDAGSTKQNFIVPEESSDIPRDLGKSPFNYVLLSADDWRAISTHPEIGNQLEEEYSFFFDGRNILVLLKPKP